MINIPQRARQVSEATREGASDGIEAELRTGHLLPSKDDVRRRSEIGPGGLRRFCFGGFQDALGQVRTADPKSPRGAIVMRQLQDVIVTDASKRIHKTRDAAIELFFTWLDSNDDFADLPGPAGLIWSLIGIVGPGLGPAGDARQSEDTDDGRHSKNGQKATLG